MVASILNAAVQILIWERLMHSQVLMPQLSVICVDGCQLISAEGWRGKLCMLMLQGAKGPEWLDNRGGEWNYFLKFLLN